MDKKENKKTNQRLESTKKYIDDLSKNYSRLNIVRVDLGYKKEHKDNVTLEEANKNFKTMLNNKRSKPTIFDGMVGYVAKKELGEDKGVHIHMLVIYDGQKVREDITKGTQIGEYWKDNITKGNGVFHNCNQNNYKDYKAVGISNITHGIFPDVQYYFSNHHDCLPSPGYTDGIFYDLVEDAKAAGERPTAAFPSSHVGISTICMLLAWHSRNKKLLFIMLPFYILLCLATVYIQAHYAIDAIAGFITALIFYFGYSLLADKWHK